MTKPWQIFFKWSFLGSFGLALFYFLLNSILSRGISHSFDQFAALQPWISFLILSFGVQIGLFQLIRKGNHLIGSSSTISGVSMLVCCVHHAADFLPILGVSALGLILTAYQKDFLILGLIMNVLGILYMARFLNFTNKPIFKYLLISSSILAAVFGVFAITKDIYATPESQIKQVGGVEVEVVPKQLNRGSQMIFTISLNNHSLDLNYDYTKISMVVDSDGNIYKPLNWNGGVGGHHVSGDLIFDKLSDKAVSVGLNIKGIDNQNTVFEWKL